MFEPAGTPTILGMTAPEWHAFGYGLKDGLKIWQRTHIKYDDVDSLKLSPELTRDIKDKWHYYEIGSDLPEDIALAGLVIWYSYTNWGAVQTAINTVGAIAVKYAIDKFLSKAS